jgi:hypothetical protein
MDGLVSCCRPSVWMDVLIAGPRPDAELQAGNDRRAKRRTEALGTAVAALGWVADRWHGRTAGSVRDIRQRLAASWIEGGRQRAAVAEHARGGLSWQPRQHHGKVEKAPGRDGKAAGACVLPGGWHGRRACAVVGGGGGRSRRPQAVADDGAWRWAGQASGLARRPMGWPRPDRLRVPLAAALRCAALRCPPRCLRGHRPRRSRAMAAATTARPPSPSPPPAVCSSTAPGRA